MVDRPLRLAIWAAKVALYAGLFFGVGGAFFACWIAGARSSATAFSAVAMALGIVAAGLSVGLQGRMRRDGAGRPSPAYCRDTGLATSYGLTALVAVLALATGLIALRLKGWPASCCRCSACWASAWRLPRAVMPAPPRRKD